MPCDHNGHTLGQLVGIRIVNQAPEQGTGE